jgi:hypothetical protein
MGMEITAVLTKAFAEVRVLASDILARVEALLPSIHARSVADGAAGCVSPDTIQKLEDADIFEVLVPRWCGGHGLGRTAIDPQVAH